MTRFAVLRWIWTAMHIPAIVMSTFIAAMTGAASVSIGGTGLPEDQPVRSGVCMRDWANFVQTKPLEQKPKVLPRLKKLNTVSPAYPALPTGTRPSGSAWSGEFLIDHDGRVVQVWPIREIKFTPPFPAFNAAIVDAIQKWRYAPLIADGKPISMCATVAIGVNWQ